MVVGLSVFSFLTKFVGWGGGYDEEKLSLNHYPHQETDRYEFNFSFVPKKSILSKEKECKLLNFTLLSRFFLKIRLKETDSHYCVNQKSRSISSTRSSKLYETNIVDPKSILIEGNGALRSALSHSQSVLNLRFLFLHNGNEK